MKPWLETVLSAIGSSSKNRFPQYGFIGLFHWGMGFCSNGAKLELESRAAYPPTLSEQKPEIPFEPYINMVR